MKVTCQSCQAKYTIADEKVRGKVAKIRCKKCGTTIIVNGTDGTGVGVSEPPQAGPPVADYSQAGSSDEPWTVLIAEGDQRTLTTGEISELIASGTIFSETPAWKDGMAEWAPIAQIDSLRGLLEGAARPAATPPGDSSGAAAAAAAPPPPPPLSAAAAAPAAKRMGIKAPEPAAARRAGRGAAVDMFGGTAQEDVLTSASANPTPHAGGDDKMTGARNENSVLFSLSALTGGGGMPGGANASQSEPLSSKADLRALMRGSESNGRGTAQATNKLDDIMNLGGGGVYSPALMAPVLTAPSVDFSTVPADTTGGDSKPKSKMLIWVLLGGAILVGGAAIVFTTGGKTETSDKASALATASAAATPTIAPLASAASAVDTTPKAPEQPVAAVAAPAPTPEPAPTVLSPGQAAPKAADPERKAAPKAIAEPKAAPAPEPKAAPAPPPEPKPAPAPAAGGSGDFDRAAALSALSAAATSAQSCKKADGPTGSGRIAVTFANNGAATTATVEGPPFAGTPVGGCVAARFRGAHVPPFGGTAVTVHKSFNIN